MKKLILLLLFIPLVSFGQEIINFNNEAAVREYFDSNAEGIEGIWEYAGSSRAMRLAIIKRNFKYQAIALEKKGDIKLGI